MRLKKGWQRNPTQNVRNLLLKLAEMFKMQLGNCKFFSVCVWESLGFLNDGGQAVVEGGNLGRIEVEGESSLETEELLWVREDLWVVLGGMEEEEEGGEAMVREKDRAHRTACVKTGDLEEVGTLLTDQEARVKTAGVEAWF